MECGAWWGSDLDHGRHGNRLRRTQREVGEKTSIPSRFDETVAQERDPPATVYTPFGYPAPRAARVLRVPGQQITRRRVTYRKCSRRFRKPERT